MIKASPFLRGILSIQTILLILIALSPFVLSPVCPAMPNGKFMPCHYSGLLITVLAAFLAALSLLITLIPVRRLILIGHAIVVLGVALCYLIPTRILPVSYAPSKLFGLCGHVDMPCQHTFHLVTIGLILVAVISIGTFMWQWLRRVF